MDLDEVILDIIDDLPDGMKVVVVIALAIAVLLFFVFAPPQDTVKQFVQEQGYSQVVLDGPGLGFADCDHLYQYSVKAINQKGGQVEMFACVDLAHNVTIKSKPLPTPISTPTPIQPPK